MHEISKISTLKIVLDLYQCLTFAAVKIVTLLHDVSN